MRMGWWAGLRFDSTLCWSPMRWLLLQNPVLHDITGLLRYAPASVKAVPGTNGWTTLWDRGMRSRILMKRGTLQPALHRIWEGALTQLILHVLSILHVPTSTLLLVPLRIICLLQQLLHHMLSSPDWCMAA